MKSTPVDPEIEIASEPEGPSRAHPLERSFATAWSAASWQDLHVILAVSGGADSTALLRAMHRAKSAYGGTGRLYVAHMHHGARGSEAEADVDWLKALCEQLELPLELGRGDVAALAAVQGDGWEAAARTARYEFLTSTAERLGARYVATGHTADDQIETILQRIVRGTGLAGLGGIPASRNLSASVTLVRPMLNTRRRDVIEYLEALGQDFRTDSMNRESRFNRNRVRHEVLPMLRNRFNANVDEAVLRLAEQARDAQQFLETTADAIAAGCLSVEFVTSERSVEGGSSDIRKQAARVTLECGRLALQPTIVVCEVFRLAWRSAGWPEQSMGYDEWRLLAHMAESDEPKPAANLPGNIVARRCGEAVVCERLGLP